MTIPNYFDQTPNQEVEDDFLDQPEEINPGKEAPEAQVALPSRPVRPTTPTVQLPATEPSYEEEELPEEQGQEEQEDFSGVLNDARIRLEQGRLYEMIMNHDLFQGTDADPKAIKFVQKQIRNFAKEQMEIMLGMRQEKQESTNTFPVEAFPFNSLEVKVIKDLAAAATKGASREAEPISIDVPPQTRKSLNPIGGNVGHKPLPKPQRQPVKSAPLPRQPSSPIKRNKADVAIQRILAEEGVTLEEVNQVFDPNKRYLTPEELANLTPEQVIERNKQIRNRQAQNPNALPMPSQEVLEQMAIARATTAAAHPQMQKIMGLLEEAQFKKGK